jgi:uncharacterized membrane protein
MGSEVLARSIGAWLGGFAITVLAGYILLRLARSPKRRPGTAAVLRGSAVLATTFLAYASYVGGHGRLNLGNLFAFLVITAWALRQQLRRKVV